MVFCNDPDNKIQNKAITVTILILIDGFLQYDTLGTIGGAISVTILILIDGFLQ